MRRYSEEFIKNNSSLFYLLPNGKYFPYLKEDIRFVIDDKIPFTFIPILEEMDIPYVPKEWDNLVDKYESIDNKSIIGRYVAKMKLAAYKSMRFADSEKACQIELSSITYWDNDTHLVYLNDNHLRTSVQGTSSEFYPRKNYKVSLF